MKILEQMRGAFFNWSNAISDESWDLIPNYEHEFLTQIEAFEAAGGQFESLKGTNGLESASTFTFIIDIGRHTQSIKQHLFFNRFVLDSNFFGTHDWIT